MPEHLPFDAKIVDQSNADGFQFAFHCLRCDTAYMSHFHALSSLAADAGGNVLKKAGGLLGSRAGKEVEKAGGFLGKQMGQAVEKVGDYAGDRAADAVKDKAKDRAFQAAVEEVAHQFILCPHCHRWMCQSRCFNAAADLCQDCAFQGDTAQRRPSLPNNVPPLEYEAASPPMYVGHASTSMPSQLGVKSYLRTPSIQGTLRPHSRSVLDTRPLPHFACVFAPVATIPGLLRCP